ncbi:serine/threonine-protein kinase LMTK2-like [Conger conger]|uniref:serine/threonine-protein kinase LMTK2-like n=1 Tax=Conger conger TaxID=82655 RepID=UPI002A5AD6F6|nr:serine/threonine-protein kinase LMTK2-like [Conger conger]
MMENCHGLYLLLATGILQLALVVEGAPLPSDTGFAAEGLPVLGLSLAVSVATLVALLVLLLNCTSCCKERDINFEEFDDNFPDEVDFTPPAEDTPSLQPNTEVYTLAVPPLALPGPPRLEPPPNTGVREGSTAPQVTRQSLSYIQEIGNGWFGKVLLSEIFSEQELGASRVLVQELAASADSPEQKRFLLQAEPYRVLQHPNIVHCLGQCVDSVPFLLVFEHYELGDLKGCLRQQDWMLHNIELLQLQKMACEIAAGVTHLHKHNFLHSDLALRNCFLTSDLTVKVGDYGTGPSRYKDDYLTVAAEQMVPLRWVAPELVSGPHTSLGGLVTKPGNVWALGVTLWELLESAAQPYSQLSDQEVLIHVIKDQNVRLSKPQLDLPYSDRWYEALQFCWLPQDKRATAEEVHRLLTYLRMQGQRQAEEDFQQRWDALRPRPAQGHTSFPILDRFSEPDELLTVTETSHGLSFEYVWEAARHDPSALSHQSVFFPTPHYEAPEPAEAAHGLLSVFDKSGSGNEYYIQLEDQELGAGERNSQCSQPGAGPQPNVLLQDTGLDESGTEPDFFHQSLDSRDSNPASQPESPYRAHIFSESTSSAPDHPWASSLLDLPEFSTGSLQRGVPSVEAGMGNSSAFGGFMDLSHLGEAEGQDVVGGHLLDLPNLSDDFLFPRAGNLAREGGNWGQRKDALVTDSDSVPDPDLRVISMEYSEVATSDEVESASDPALSRVEPPNFIMPLPLPLMKNETLVPSGMPDAGGDDPSNSFSNRASSPDEGCILLNSLEPRTDLVLDPTSEHPARPVNSHQSPLLGLSGNTDTLCNDAKNISAPESLNERPVVIECPAEQCSLSPPSTNASKTASDSMDSDHGVTDETVSDRVLQDDTVSDRVLQDDTVSDRVLQDDTVSDRDLQDDTVSDRVLQNETVSDRVLQDETVSDRVLQDETVSDCVLQDATVSDHVLQDETVSDRVLQDETVSDCVLQDATVSDLGLMGEVVSDLGLTREVVSDRGLMGETVSDYVHTDETVRGYTDEIISDRGLADAIASDQINLSDSATSEHSHMDKNDAGQIGSVHETASDCGFKDGALSDATCLREGIGLDRDLMDEAISDYILTNESDLDLLDAPASNQGHREETASDHDPTNETVSDQGRKDEAVSDQRSLDDDTSDSGLTEGLISIGMGYPVTDSKLQETTNGEHPSSLPEGPPAQDNTPQALIPDPPLDQTSQESLLDDSGLASVTTVEGLAETPDSTESLNVHQLQPPCRTTDSGYDTENMESPECSSKGEVSPEGEDSAEPSPIAPEVIVLEAESTLDAVEIIFPSSPAPMESPLAIGHQNYRDSAYFSDNESEPEKRLEESGTGDPTGSTLWQTESLRASGVTCNILAPNKEEEGNTGLPESQCKVPQEPENLCNWKSVPELVLTPAETWAQGEAGSINGCEETGEQSTLGSREDPAGHARPSSPPAPEVHDGTFHAKLVRTHAGMGPGPKFRERDAEGRYLVAGGDGAEDGSEADEEDENSEDSDDEDMQAYRLHSSASDSDDEPPPPAPIIIMDTSHARSLRSLLKAAAPSSAVSNAHSLPGKKAVSFFNDVTLYLFDQETPTKDLGDQLSGSCSQASECCSPAPSSSLLNRVTNSESSTDEEGGTFEWEDDFSSSDSFVSKATGDLDKPKASPAVASHYFSPPPPGHAPEQSWSRPSSFSRFSISPASISNFSLTHLTDSDMEQGSSEDGEKE